MGIEGAKAVKVLSLSDPSTGQFSLIHTLKYSSTSTASGGKAQRQAYTPDENGAVHAWTPPSVPPTPPMTSPTPIINDRGMSQFASSTTGLAPRASLFQITTVGENGPEAVTDEYIKIATLCIVNMARSQAAQQPIEVDRKGELTDGRDESCAVPEGV
ncbi:hypothetical protein FRC09_020553 [Ceratobasidium sp. 395]|nr:hypothetical protein FRC09_020553 [Ceratobasidium sp. 395]